MTKVNLTQEDLEKCKRARAILEKNYSHHYTHSQLARMVGTNENKLRAGFKVVCDNTIYEFLTALRIEKAKELLETTYLPVESIAYRLGLDKSNLIKQFKKLTGMTPRGWRKGRQNIEGKYAS